jgi:hypothetical protein
MRDGGEVVDDEPARGRVVDYERRDEPRDEPRDVPRHPDARRRRSSRRRARDEPRDVPKQPVARCRKIDSAFTRAKLQWISTSRRVDEDQERPGGRWMTAPQ